MSASVEFYHRIVIAELLTPGTRRLKLSGSQDFLELNFRHGKGIQGRFTALEVIESVPKGSLRV